MIMFIANSFVMLFARGSGFIFLALLTFIVGTWALSMITDWWRPQLRSCPIFSPFPLHDDTELFKSILWKWANTTVPNGFTPSLNRTDRSATIKWYCSNGPLSLSCHFVAYLGRLDDSMGAGSRWRLELGTCQHECCVGSLTAPSLPRGNYRSNVPVMSFYIGIVIPNQDANAIDHMRLYTQCNNMNFLCFSSCATAPFQWWGFCSDDWWHQLGILMSLTVQWIHYFGRSRPEIIFLFPLYPCSLCTVYFIDALHWHSGTQIIIGMQRLFNQFGDEMSLSDQHICYDDKLSLMTPWMTTFSFPSPSDCCQCSTVHLDCFLFHSNANCWWSEQGDTRNWTMLILLLHRRYELWAAFCVIFPMMVNDNKCLIHFWRWCKTRTDYTLFVDFLRSLSILSDGDVWLYRKFCSGIQCHRLYAVCPLTWSCVLSFLTTSCMYAMVTTSSFGNPSIRWTSRAGRAKDCSDAML